MHKDESKIFSYIIFNSSINNSVANSGAIAQVKAWHVFKYDRNKFVEMPVNLYQISIGSDGSFWRVNSKGMIYKYDGKIFQQVTGALTSIAVGADGSVWGLKPFDNITTG